MGDVQVVPERRVPAPADPLVQVQRSFDEIRFADLLADTGIVDPVSLPGVQDKASAWVISVPLSHGHDRWILEVDPPECPHLVVNEAYFLGLGHRVGMPVAHARVVTDADGRAGLLVRRFDRLPGPDDTATRRAVEDACQLLDRWPADKYQVSSERLVAREAGVCAAAAVARRDVYRQLVCAWVTGNGDVHAKNVSVLADASGEWRVSPAYDLPCTAFHGDRSLALSLTGRTRGLSRRLLLEFAAAIGLPERSAVRVLDQVLEGTRSLCADLADGALPFTGAALADTVAELRHPRRQLGASLTAAPPRPRPAGSTSAAGRRGRG